MTEARDNMLNDMVQKLHYNNPLFLCYVGHTCCPPETDYVVKEHWHEEIEYLIVTQGVFHYSVNGKQIELHGGEGIMVNSKRIHANFSPAGESCEFRYVIMHPSYLAASPYIEQKYLSPLISPESIDYVFLKKDDWTSEIIEDVLHLMGKEQEEGYELEIIECAYRAFRLIYRNLHPALSDSHVSSVYDASFKAMLGYVRDHYTERISLSDIADAGGCGKTLCAKLFRKFTSETPGQYLIHYRITKGAELLTKTDRSVTEIAYEVGFTGPSHFTQTFRDVMGTTPNQYRQSRMRDAAEAKMA